VHRKSPKNQQNFLKHVNYGLFSYFSQNNLTTFEIKTSSRGKRATRVHVNYGLCNRALEDFLIGSQLGPNSTLETAKVLPAANTLYCSYTSLFRQYYGCFDTDPRLGLVIASLEGMIRGSMTKRRSVTNFLYFMSHANKNQRHGGLV